MFKLLPNILVLGKSGRENLDVSIYFCQRVFV